MKAQDLKNSILHLAIQGKLVDQQEGDGTAKELLEKIKLEKKQLIKEGKIKKQKALPDIKDDEKLFDLPDSWEWVRFGEIVNFNMGKTPPRSEMKYWKNEYNWVSIADMIADGYIYETKEKISEIALKEKFKMSFVPKGTLLMSFKLTIGKVSILNINAVHNEAIISIYPYADSEESTRNYLFAMLPLLSTYGETKGAIKGKTLNSTSLNNLLIPLPTLEEQKRIVAKIEELMPYVDQYDVAYSEVEELNKNFPEDMQKSILQYAIQGKLVEQREEDGTAKELYTQILEEKKKLIKEGKIKKEKPLSEITEDEIPFDIPANWKWVKFRDLCALLTCGYASTPKYVSADVGMPFISAKNIKPYNFLPKEHNYISKELYKKLTKTCNPQKGDILLTRVGAGIGEAAIIDRDFPFAIYVSLTLIKLVNYNLLDNRYILYWLNSPIGVMSSIKNIFGKGASQGNLNVANVRNFLLPLPPLAEQKRIVERIEELLPYTKQLVK